MTVQECIAILLTCNPDEQVYFETDHGHGVCAITAIVPCVGDGWLQGLDTGEHAVLLTT